MTTSTGGSPSGRSNATPECGSAAGRRPTRIRRTAETNAFTLVRVEGLLISWYGRFGRNLPVAAHQRPVRDPRQRGDAAADAGRSRRPSLPRLARAVAERGDARGRARGRCDSRLARAGYNRRALALHRAAQIVARDGWPCDLTDLPGVGPYTAAAIGNFALGEDVLPHDVNVDRVERRTQHSFTGAAAQALMDLGATVCLARIPRCDACPLAASCPSRGTRDEPARKQGRFEGSFRQRRAATLRHVSVAATPEDALDSEAVAALARDGLVVLRTDGTVALPS